MLLIILRLSFDKRRIFCNIKFICDSCETMLHGNSDFFENLYKKDKKLAKDFVDAIKRLVERIKSFVTDRHANTEYGKALLQVADDLYSQIQQLWNEAVESGLETVNNRATKNAPIENKVKNSDSGYRSYQNINLNNLDDEDLKVYNNRGWAYDLFTDEDIVLLNEKIDELNPKIKTQTSPTLYNNSIIVDLNNKLVVLSGTHNNPEIHSVFVISSKSETIAEWTKDEIIYEGEQYAKSREQFEEFGRAYESIVGIQNVGFFSSYDYSHIKGRADTGQRAIYNASPDYYGYTKQFQDRTRDNTEAKIGESSVKATDRDYLSAVERGDMETAQRMVDEAQLKKAAAGNACDSFCNYSAILISTGNQINLLR